MSDATHYSRADKTHWRVLVTPKKLDEIKVNIINDFLISNFQNLANEVVNQQIKLILLNEFYKLWR